MTQPDVALPDRYGFEFKASGGDYVFLFLKHIFLTLLTFGVYFAWAKSERRAFIWQGLSFHGQAFRYTGTGLELFKGYLIALVAYLLFVGVPALVSESNPELGGLIQIVFVLLFFALVPFVIYRSRNFLYNRTVWRGIRFGLAPDAKPFAKQFYIGTLLTVLTFGLYYPVQANRLHAIQLNRTHFGNMPFRYDGADFVVWKMAVKGYLLSLLTFGLYYFWYRAALERYQAEHTYIGPDAVLHSDLTGGKLFELFLINTFGLTLTLGLAFPWILMHSFRELARRYEVVGSIDFASVLQRDEAEDAASDSIADVFDLDFGL